MLRLRFILLLLAICVLGETSPLLAEGGSDPLGYSLRHGAVGGGGVR